MTKVVDISNKPVVTVYVPCHSYGHFLEVALESVLAQSFRDWELIIVDDGSRDETAKITERFRKKLPEQISVITHKKEKGLQACANSVLRVARGRYVMRLDPDDYLDESALLVLTSYLDEYPDVALVHPNYVYVDQNGNHLGVEQRQKSDGGEALLDLPAHGACSLVRKRVLKAVGGYDENFDRQDGYDLWLKIVNRYPVGHVPTPLFYYRQHPGSLSSNKSQLLETRAKIKRAWVEKNSGSVKPSIVAVVGAKNTYSHLPNIVLTELAGQVLLDYTLSTALECNRFDMILVTTDDPAVVEYTENYGDPKVRAHLRPDELSGDWVTEESVMSEVVNFLDKDGIRTDILVSLNVHCPLRKAEQIEKAIDTLLVYNVDSVVSVFEDYNLHYVHSSQGMEPLNPAMHRQIRVDREALYTGNGALLAAWTDSIGEADMISRKVGHIVMPWWDSLQIKSKEDAWFVELVMEKRINGDMLSPRAWLTEGESDVVRS